MDVVHLHLMLNHAPVAGVAFGMLFLMIATIRGGQTFRTAAAVLFVLSAILVVPVFLTGSAAEDQVERLSGIDGRAIERHEDAAQAALYATLVLGLFAAWALLLLRRVRVMPHSIVTAMGVSSLLVVILIGQAARYGGEIRHVEINNTVPHIRESEQDDTSLRTKHTVHTVSAATQTIER